ncbi:MAG: Hydantoinase/oxoprolinase [Candidatus Methanolliviera sp. GoM_asphalt]|nr:MAG: Hydantoinase/oxoprolinase [Candidatus Methanolliviera sp. GoM_asphalt]
MILGLDIGGANTKAASSDGSYSRSFYLPLWKDSRLKEILKKIKEEGREVEKVSVVMTGEGADCFSTKEEGIRYMRDAVDSVFEDEDIYYFSLDGKFEREIRDEKNFFSPNWLASSVKLSEDLSNFLFVDMGSTTTDIIPVIDRRCLSEKTDFKRLLNGNLIYFGAFRTDVSAMIDEIYVPIADKYCRISTERYASMADVYMIIGKIKEEDYTCETPDGKEKSLKASKKRLARIVCCDLKELEEEDIKSMAEQVKEKQLEVLCREIENSIKRYSIDDVVIAGAGEFVVKEALEREGVDYTPLSDIYGEEISSVFPAFAVASLAMKKA